MSDNIDRIHSVRDRLNKVSPSFCLAKWLQVTIHLQTGHTHSCHHPGPHKIPVEEIAVNPTALHNTEFKKGLRKQMLAGERPKECDYCWRIEDTPGNHLSDRHMKSSDPWAEPHLEAVRKMPWDLNVSPTYVEVSFSNLCNFKCSYCHPKDSSKWMEEVRTFGGYPTTSRYNNFEDLKNAGEIPIPEGETNPYVEAFWKWWPELYKTLEVFRITGGEPLLDANTFKILDYIDEHPNPKLELSINSNLGVSQKLVDRLISRIKNILENRKVNNITLYTSIDSWGAQAEYIRHGLRLETFIQNVDRILSEVPQITLSFMCTFNAMSVTNFQPLLEYIISLREKFCIDKEDSPKIFLDINYLRHPGHQSVKILTAEYADQVARHLAFMEDHSVEKIGSRTGFHEFEIVKMRRLHAWMLQPEHDGWTLFARKNFFLFCEEHDKRRGTDFLKTFPEMTRFWFGCKAIVLPS